MLISPRSNPSLTQSLIVSLVSASRLLYILFFFPEDFRKWLNLKFSSLPRVLNSAYPQWRSESVVSKNIFHLSRSGEGRNVSLYLSFRRTFQPGDSGLRSLSRLHNLWRYSSSLLTFLYRFDRRPILQAPQFTFKNVSHGLLSSYFIVENCFISGLPGFLSVPPLNRK